MKKQTVLKLLLLIVLTCLITDTYSQVTFQRDFEPFLKNWSDKSSLYLENATRMNFLLWLGAMFTIAAGTIPFLNKNSVKIIAFILALSGTAITQYHVAFEVDPKFISKKAKKIQVMIEDFQLKIENSDINDEQIARQLLFDKKELEKELIKLDRQIRGISDEIAMSDNDLSTPFFFATANLISNQQLMDCVPTRLDYKSGQLLVNNVSMELPVSVTTLISGDTSSLFLVGASIDPDLTKSLFRTDSCLSNSIKKFLSGFVSADFKQQQTINTDLFKLSDEIYKNYQKNPDGNYQSFKIIKISRDLILSYSKDVYGNFDRRKFLNTEKDLNEAVTQTKVIRNDSTEVFFIGRLYKKERSRIDSTKFDQVKAANTSIKIIDSQGREIGSATSDHNGQYSIQAKFVANRILYVTIYGDGSNQPYTRKRTIYVPAMKKIFIPNYYIKDY